MRPLKTLDPIVATYKTWPRRRKAANKLAKACSCCPPPCRYPAHQVSSQTPPLNKAHPLAFDSPPPPQSQMTPRPHHCLPDSGPAAIGDQDDVALHHAGPPACPAPPPRRPRPIDGPRDERRRVRRRDRESLSERRRSCGRRRRCDFITMLGVVLEGGQ